MSIGDFFGREGISVALSTTSSDTGSDGLDVYGDYNISLFGTWAGTVHLQRSFDSEVSWVDIDSFVANVELVGLQPENGVVTRLFVKAGNYTSGTIEGRLSQ